MDNVVLANEKNLILIHYYIQGLLVYVHYVCYVVYLDNLDLDKIKQLRFFSIVFS